MSSKNTDIDNLIALMAKLPGLGPRSARRAVLHLIKKRSILLSPLADSLFSVAQTARECTLCGNIGTEDLCEICTNGKRQNRQICVVEDVSDLWAMERGAAFKGRYHVLGGCLSALDGVGPEELRIFGELPEHLHEGEASCIAIARNRKWQFLSDDLAARNHARSLDVAVSGSIGCLVQAIEHGHCEVEEANSYLQDMIQQGYHSPLSDLTPLLEEC